MSPVVPYGVRVSDRSLRPVVVTAAVAVVAVGALALALVQGWLGPDVGRGATFCEAARDGIVRQPANTLSNVGFIIAGLFVAWRAGAPTGSGSVLATHPGLAASYACGVVLLGPGSAAMHASQSALGGHLDTLSMYVVASFAASYALMRWLHRGPLFLAQVFSLAVAGCELVGQVPGKVPLLMFAGNVAFAALLLVAITLEVLMHRRRQTRIDLRWGVGAVLTMVVALVIWTLSQHAWCDPHSWLQGHAAWHLLGAVAAYLLFRMWDSEQQAGQTEPDRAATSPGTPAAHG